MLTPDADTVTKKSPHAKFQRLTGDGERKDFYAKLTGAKWWLGGNKRSSNFGWLNVFENSDGKCVYCSRDLAASTDALAESTEEHLVPRSLLEASSLPSDNEHNMAVCCAGCNGLKAEHVPAVGHPCWKSRRTYVKECARFVAECRLKNFQKYKERVEKVLKKRAGL
jgi:ribosomal protein S30